MKLKFVEAERFYDLYNNLTEEEISFSREFIETDYDFGDFEVMYAYHKGCILLRYYSDDAGYHFDAPFPISDFADVPEAFAAISEYCKLEAVPETVVGVEPDWLDCMLRGAKRYSIREDDDGSFAVKIITECADAEFLPEILYDDVYLGEFADSYAKEYERLLKNANLNCHFGYNILDDMPNGTGMDFIKNARNEFENSESMTFAATVMEDGNNVFVGEGALYAFDGRGGASVAFRVLPEFHGRGIGKKIFLGLMKISKCIGLERLTAEVKKQNEPSLRLLSKFGSGEICGETVRFVFKTAGF